ncbi:hypothetical protein ACFQ9X_34260 [Catenulispora yoronensis]
MRATAAVRPSTATEHDFTSADRLLRQLVRRAPGWPLVLTVAVAISTAAALTLPAALADAVNGVLSGRGDSACVRLWPFSPC